MYNLKFKTLGGAGFTLIEIMIALVITVALGYMLSVILIQSNNIFFSQNAQVTQGLGLNQTSLTINDAIKSASAIVASSTTTPVYNSSNSSLVLTIPSLDSSGNALTDSSDYLVITPDTTNPKILRFLIFPTLPQSFRQAENRVLVSDLASINFIYQDQAGNTVIPTSASRVSYTVIVAEKAGLTTRQNQTSSIVNLRNN